MSTQTDSVLAMLRDMRSDLRKTIRELEDKPHVTELLEDALRSLQLAGEGMRAYRRQEQAEEEPLC